MPVSLDAIDIKILDLMQRDASLSTAELAERVGLSQSPCWRRIQRLREEGFIKGVVAIVDPQLMGFRMQIFAMLKVLAPDVTWYQDFIFNVILKLPGVIDVRSIVTLSESKSTTAIPLRARQFR